MASAEVVVGLSGTARHPLRGQLLVAEVHVVHVVHARVVRDVQLRIELRQLQQLVLHRQYAPYHHRAAGIHVGAAGEHLGKPLVHPPRNVAVLPCAERRQFAEPSAGLAAQVAYPFHHVAPQGSEHPGAVGLRKGVVRVVVLVASDEEPRPVAAVMADVERPFPVGSLCLPCRQGVRVCQVVRCREAHVSLYLSARRLCRGCQDR